MSAREIITIQCGHYSNFVGTHWWNLQESAFCYESAKGPTEIHNDCMFREGLNLNGEQTYTPRLIAVDRSGSLGSLKQSGTLYDVIATPTQLEQGDLAWRGEVEKYMSEPAKKNEFLSDLELLDAGQMKPKVMTLKTYRFQNDVEVWSDFLRIHLHPRSILTVPGIFHGDDSCFNVFPSGQAVWNSKLQDSFEEQLHFFVEECDSLQGFQLLADVRDGFGGLASCFAEELADHFSQKGLLSFALSPDVVPLEQTSNFQLALLSNAMCMDNLCTLSSLVCPLSLLEEPWRDHTHPGHKAKGILRSEHSLPYQSAALFASALETSSLIYRTCHAPLSLSSLADTLTMMGRKVCAMGLSLPLSLPADSSFLSELDRNPLHTRLQPLTPFCTVDDELCSLAVAIRGLPPDYPICFPKDKRYSYCNFHPSLALGSHLSSCLPHCFTHFTVVGKPLTLGNPFPPLLPEHHTSREVPVCASFQSQSGLQLMLQSLSMELKRLNIRKVPSFAETCLDRDNYAELKDRLMSLAECYTTQCQTDD